jgi:hypothetical protein
MGNLDPDGVTRPTLKLDIGEGPYDALKCNLYEKLLSVTTHIAVEPLPWYYPV